MIREQFAPKLAPIGVERNEYAAALLMGRFRDGSPLVLDGKPSDHGSSSFDFLSDQTGSRCPISAHIRKVNPRGTSDSNERVSRSFEDAHVIARRSIPYPLGLSNAPHLNPQCDLEHLPKKGVGILFMCFQSSITGQFEFIQREWANDRFFPSHLEEVTASDAVVSTTGERGNTWPVAWDSNQRVRFTPSKTITFRGGEYFFAPSMAFAHRWLN